MKRITLFCAMALVALLQFWMTEAAANPETEAAVELANVGDIEGAIALLDAILIANPLDLDARFLRSKLLVLSGRGAEVLGDLRTLESLGVSEADQAEIDQLIKIALRDDKRLSGTVFLEWGLGYTDNANNWPTAGKSTNPFDGSVLTPSASIYGGSRAYSDTTVRIRFGANGTYRLSEHGRTLAYYALMLSRVAARQTVESEGRTLSVSTGMRHRMGRAAVTFGLNYSNADRVNRYGTLRLPVTTDTVDRSVSVGLDFRVGSVGLLAYNVSLGEHDHSGLDQADLSDADSTVHRVTWQSPIGGDSYYIVRAYRAQSRAQLSVDQARRISDKDRTRLSATYGTALGDHKRLELAASYGVTEFPRQVIGGSGERKDREHMISALYAHDLQDFSDRLEGWEVGLKVAYRTTDSNQLLAEVKETTGTLTLKHEWSF